MMEVVVATELLEL